jgi:hypothetical protein
MAGTGVRATHADYDAYSAKWKRCRDVVAGQDAMHTARTAYLPKLKDESDGADGYLNGTSDGDYGARLKRSDFFNATWRTIDALGGMVFRKPIKVEVPAGIKDYLDDITMSGVSMEDFAKEILEDELAVGRIGILVDYPQRPDNVVPLTVAAAQAQGYRPTLQLYSAENIRNWKFTRINNSWMLSMVVLGEKAPVPKDEFTDDMEDRYRVLDLVNGSYRQRLFKVVDQKDVLIDEFYPLMNNAPLNFIPFKIVDPNGKGDCIDEPPLIDLVDKNVAHYQVNSDYRHGLHFTALPVAFFAGLQLAENEKITIGSSSAIVSPEPTAKASYLEFSGDGLKTIESALTRLETQMALLGARMIADETKSAVETLGGTIIKRAGENAVLSKISRSVSRALEWALGVFADWAGSPGKITYELNRDFIPPAMDGRQLVALVTAVQGGFISHEEFFELMQRSDVIDSDKTFEEHQAQVDAQGPTAVPAPAPQQGAAA